jgi:hypothetical protein
MLFGETLPLCHRAPAQSLRVVGNRPNPPVLTRLPSQVPAARQQSSCGAILLRRCQLHWQRQQFRKPQSAPAQSANTPLDPPHAALSNQSAHRSPPHHLLAHRRPCLC